MDLLKNLVFLAALAVVAGGVYILLTNNPQTTPPPGVDPNWSAQSNPLNVEVPGTPAPTASLPGGMPSLGAPGSAAPPASTAAAPISDPNQAYAPRYTPPPPRGAVQSDSEAPAFSPPPPAGNTGNMATNHTEPVDLRPGGATTPSAPPPSGPSTDPVATADNGVRGEFEAFIAAAVKKAEEGGLIEAHESLSGFYADPRLRPDEDRQLTELLDQVAGTVVYSRQHLLEPPHVVQPGENLAMIAQKYEVPWQLLAKINGLRNPEHLPPGLQLKVVRGPFDAVIRLDRYELTLMLHGRYAGRFRIGIGRDQPVLEGAYTVRDKTVNPTYYGNGQVIDADDPGNPLGERLIGLGNRISLHGTNDPQNIGRSGGPGTISMGDRDIEDVYDILSVGSRVLIQR